MPYSIKALKKKKFLERYPRYCIMGRAARAAGVSRQQVYNWLEGDKDFAAKFEDAKLEAVELLEKEARRRGVDGVKEPVFYKGQVCGAIRKYSDTLLIVLLKGLAPEKYRERVDTLQHGEVILEVKYDDSPGG